MDPDRVFFRLSNFLVRNLLPLGLGVLAQTDIFKDIGGIGEEG